MKRLTVMAAAIALLATSAKAVAGDSRGIQQEFAAALVPSVQTPTCDADVTLARFSLLAGRNRNVYGMDFSVIGNLTSEDMVGFEFAGLFNAVGMSRSAFQLSGLFGLSRGDFTGLQASLGASVVQTRCAGLQIGSATIADMLCGMQLGIFNKARLGTGFQLGGINVSERFTGVQIGIINLNLDSSVPMSPILNAYF